MKYYKSCIEAVLDNDLQGLKYMHELGFPITDREALIDMKIENEFNICLNKKEQDFLTSLTADFKILTCLAAANDNLEMLKYLIDNGAVMSANTIYFACSSQTYQCLQYIVDSEYCCDIFVLNKCFQLALTKEEKIFDCFKLLVEKLFRHQLKHEVDSLSCKLIRRFITDFVKNDAFYAYYIPIFHYFVNKFRENFSTCSHFWNNECTNNLLEFSDLNTIKFCVEKFQLDFDIYFQGNALPLATKYGVPQTIDLLLSKGHKITTLCLIFAIRQRNLANIKHVLSKFSSSQLKNLLTYEVFILSSRDKETHNIFDHCYSLIQDKEYFWNNFKPLRAPKYTSSMKTLIHIDDHIRDLKLIDLDKPLYRGLVYMNIDKRLFPSLTLMIEAKKEQLQRTSEVVRNVSTFGKDLTEYCILKYI